MSGRRTRERTVAQDTVRIESEHQGRSRPTNQPSHTSRKIRQSFLSLLLNPGVQSHVHPDNFRIFSFPPYPFTQPLSTDRPQNWATRGRHTYMGPSLSFVHKLFIGAFDPRVSPQRRSLSPHRLTGAAGDRSEKCWGQIGIARHNVI